MRAPDVHPLLRRRWSPTQWDARHELSDDELAALLEAARWAPSAGNSQPWAFLAGRRGDDVHRRIVPHLAPSSARWAPAASLLLVNLCHVRVEDTDWEYSEFARYDLGQAVAHLSVQAQALGLAVRQFAAFERDAVTRAFGVAPHWEVVTMAAVGRVPDGVGPPAGAAPGPGAVARERRPLADLLREALPGGGAPVAPYHPRSSR